EDPPPRRTSRPGPSSPRRHCSTRARPESCPPPDNAVLAPRRRDPHVSTPTDCTRISARLPPPQADRLSPSRKPEGHRAPSTSGRPSVSLDLSPPLPSLPSPPLFSPWRSWRLGGSSLSPWRFAHPPSVVRASPLGSRTRFPVVPSRPLPP